ncbi:DDE_3 domain-containing protein [Trichonephila clavipes]|uniref:DDE_3 domain-containing protein n=1 Tax=Trichonephila clavipes TaxID=2585209 RepID=A0A8X6WJ90_TRICX|nr:DDE_3 domain-containing protein [Trichonephila clavipes]
MQWPGRSPEFSPFEHDWDALGLPVAALNPPSKNLAMPSTALEEQWLIFPAELVDRIIESITHRCMCCIDLRGGEGILPHIKSTFPVLN